MLNEFILDKDSLVYSKKLKKNTGTGISYDYNLDDIRKLHPDDRFKVLYQKEALNVRTYEPLMNEGIHEKQYHAKMERFRRE